MVRVEGAIATSTKIHFSGGIRLYKDSMALLSVSVPTTQKQYKQINSTVFKKKLSALV